MHGSMENVRQVISDGTIDPLSFLFSRTDPITVQAIFIAFDIEIDRHLVALGTIRA